jgi:hypothetical protein
MQSFEDQRLIKQEKERILLADFGQRYDIYLMYTKHVQKVSESTNLIKYLTGEKNSIEEEKKLLIDSMGRQFGWTVNGIFNVKRQMEQSKRLIQEGLKNPKIMTDSKKYNKRKLGYGATGMFGEQEDGNSEASPLKRSAESYKGDAERKVEWADRITGKNGEIKLKLYDIEREQKQKTRIKTERDKYQFRLKNLYKNLLAEPQMALERGLVRTFLAK